MRKASLLLIILTNFSLCFAQENQLIPPTDNKLKTPLDTLVQKSVSPFIKNNIGVGISIGIIQNGKPYLYNYGSTELDKQSLPTENTVYELASITKTFSSSLLARAVIEKRIMLSDDIRKYLKEEYPNLAYNGTPITILNLANLTSGLPNWMPEKDLFSKANPDSIPLS